MNPYCRKIQRHLDDYHDGVLVYFVRNVVESHLSWCGTCINELLLIQAGVETVRQLPEVEMPPAVMKRVIRRLTETGGGGAPQLDDQLGSDLAGGLESI